VDDSYELRKRCFARYCWPQRHQIAPRKTAAGGPETWAECFRRLYLEDLEAYAERMRSAVPEVQPPLSRTAGNHRGD
jgi:hypothetical protein